VLQKTGRNAETVLSIKKGAENIIIIIIIIICGNNFSGKYWAVVGPKLSGPPEDPGY
jgi:hypothetical protein